MHAPTMNKFSRQTQKDAVSAALSKAGERTRKTAQTALERINKPGASAEKRLQVATAALTKLGAAPKAK